MKTTVTEALAEVPTIQKRIEKKQEFIKAYLYRQSAVRDPHEKDGGSAELLKREMQAIDDLHQRLIDIRAAIQQANTETSITVCDETRTVADWLTWRREVAESERRFYSAISNSLEGLRREARGKGLNVTDKDSGFSPDYVVNVNEKKLSEKIERIEEVLGTLDGKLSLTNATTFIEI